MSIVHAAIYGMIPPPTTTMEQEKANAYADSEIVTNDKWNELICTN